MDEVVNDTGVLWMLRQQSIQNFPCLFFTGIARIVGFPRSEKGEGIKNRSFVILRIIGGQLLHRRFISCCPIDVGDGVGIAVNDVYCRDVSMLASRSGALFCGMFSSGAAGGHVGRRGLVPILVEVGHSYAPPSHCTVGVLVCDS